MSSTTLSRICISTGATLVLLGIMKHLYVGFPRISATLAGSEGASLHWAHLLQAMWMIFAVHFLMISALFLHSMWKQKALPTVVVIFCGLLPILDGIVIATFAPLINLLIGVPGLLFIVGGLLAAQPPQEGEAAVRPFRILLKRVAKGFRPFTKDRSTTLPAVSPSA